MAPINTGKKSRLSNTVYRIQRNINSAQQKATDRRKQLLTSIFSGTAGTKPPHVMYESLPHELQIRAWDRLWEQQNDDRAIELNGTVQFWTLTREPPMFPTELGRQRWNHHAQKRFPTVLCPATIRADFRTNIFFFQQGVVLPEANSHLGEFMLEALDYAGIEKIMITYDIWKRELIGHPVDIAGYPNLKTLYVTYEDHTSEDHALTYFTGEPDEEAWGELMQDYTDDDADIFRILYEVHAGHVVRQRAPVEFYEIEPADYAR